MQACYSYDGVLRDASQFTGKERDSESNLDMFGARYYASSLGRFMTPDWAAKPTAVPYHVWQSAIAQSLQLRWEQSVDARRS